MADRPENFFIEQIRMKRLQKPTRSFFFHWNRMQWFFLLLLLLLLLLFDEEAVAGEGRRVGQAGAAQRHGAGRERQPARVDAAAVRRPRRQPVLDAVGAGQRRPAGRREHHVDGAAPPAGAAPHHRSAGGLAQPRPTRQTAAGGAGVGVGVGAAGHGQQSGAQQPLVHGAGVARVAQRQRQVARSERRQPANGDVNERIKKKQFAKFRTTRTTRFAAYASHTPKKE